MNDVGGPYDECQTEICQTDKKCMCQKKQEIRDCCVNECQPLPSDAKKQCILSCTPTIDPCSFY